MPEPRPADWYFDVISPFAYFAWRDRERWRGRLAIRPVPVLFAGLLGHWENKGPAEIEPKRQWTYRWCTWYAAHHDIAFRMPAVHPFNPLPWLRLIVACRSDEAAVDRVFSALWTTGDDPADAERVAAVAADLGIDIAATEQPEVKQQLRTNTETAIAAGVFGVPTLHVDGHLFWGQDAAPMVEAWLADPAVLDTREVRRATALPLGQTRPQSRSGPGR